MKPISSKQAESWEEKIGETIEHLVTVIGIDWEASQDKTLSQKKKKEAYESACQYAREYCNDLISQTLQSYRQELIGKLEKEKVEEYGFIELESGNGKKSKVRAETNRMVFFNKGLQTAIDLLGGK